MSEVWLITGASRGLGRAILEAALHSGAKVLANFANSQRWASDGLTWGDEVWVHWRDNDGVVLTS